LLPQVVTKMQTDISSRPREAALECEAGMYPDGTVGTAK
jgi:hypothetical protein